MKKLGLVSSVALLVSYYACLITEIVSPNKQLFAFIKVYGIIVSCFFLIGWIFVDMHQRGWRFRWLHLIHIELSVRGCSIDIMRFMFNKHFEQDGSRVIHIFGQEWGLLSIVFNKPTGQWILSILFTGPYYFSNPFKRKGKV